MPHTFLLSALARMLLMVFVLSPWSLAQAQEEGAAEPTDSNTERARSLFAAGRAAFEANDYEDALRHFRESHALSGRPALLYNIGVAADRLRRDEEALEAFERYLREAGADAPQRGDAEARARVLRRQLHGGGGSGGSQAAASPSGGASGTALAGWAVFGAGLAVLATGAVFLGLGQTEADAYESAPEGTPWPEIVEAHDRAGWMRVTGWVLAGVGVAAAVGGIVLALSAPSPRESVALRIQPGGLALVWRHR